MVLEWTLGLKRLAYSRVDLCCSVSTVYNMGDSEPPDILCESCACIIHTKAIPNRFHVSRIRRVRFLQFAKKKKKKWARSCACVRAPNCVVVTQLCSRKKINDIHGDFNDIHAFFFFFFYPPPGSQFSLGNP